MGNDLWLPVVLAAFATYRISRMVAVEEGPFELFLNLRGVIYTMFPKPWVANGVTCPVCVGWWIGLPIAIYVGYVTHLSIIDTFLVWQAISGGSTFLYKLEN